MTKPGIALPLEYPSMSTAASATHKIKTLVEINELFEIEYEYVLTKEKYQRPIRSYELINSDAKCQYLKKSKVCGQAHQHGYVVDTSDGKLALIGHCCAFNHLGLDNHQIQNAFRQLTTSERDAIRKSRVQDVFSRKDELVQRVKELLKEAKSLQSEAQRVLSVIPEKVVVALIDRWKRNNLKINWEYLIVKRSKDERGKTITENSWYPHECGTLKGVGVWLEPEKLTFAQQLYSSLRKLESIPTNKKLTNNELELAEALINDLPQISLIERSVKDQGRLISTFCQHQNLILIIQLTSNREIRAQAVETVYSLTGEPFDSSASRFVDSIDQSIRDIYKAEGLRIGL